MVSALDESSVNAMIEKMPKKGQKIVRMKRGYVQQFVGSCCKEELTVCREQLATLKRLLSECIQNKYYDESTCSPSWLKEAREAVGLQVFLDRSRCLRPCLCRTKRTQ